MDNQAQGQPWRIKPEIDTERQKELDDRRKIAPDIKQGIYPFKGVKLNRAEVEWLLATHESEGIRGPVDLSDECQRTREGLDVRGAHLQEEDLWGLPLARLCGGLTFDEWIRCSKEQREMAAVHLQEADLGKANLQKAHLAEANLQEADLWGANLREAHLEGANLQKVDLGKANLQGADIRRANLQEAYLAEANLQEADLGKANLQEADLGKANLQEAHLAEANLQEAHLWGANLQEAHLEGANLQKANLWGANLQEADLGKANLQKANLWGANLQEADLGKANLQEADLTRAELQGADLEGVTLGNEKQVGPQLVDCRWGDVNLAVIEWSQVKILGDEYVARQKKDSQGKIKEKQTRLSEYEAAVRANRQLAIVLRDQGLNEKADDFAYRAQVLQWQVLQRQLLERLDQAHMDLQKQEYENQDAYEPERLNIPRIFMDLLYWPSFVLSTVKRAPEDFLLKTVFLLILQLVFLFYLLLFTPIILFLILLLCIPFIFIWLLGLILSLAAHLSLMPLPKQRQRLRNLLTRLHLPTIEQFKHDVCSAIQQTVFATQLFFKTLSGHASSILSSLLDLLAGYGYKPGRTFAWYIVTVSVFAWAYYQIWASYDLAHVTGQPLNSVGAIIFSITAFHGRGFFLGSNKLEYNSLVVILGAVEAVIGLLIELSFIATFTGRFFRR